MAVLLVVLLLAPTALHAADLKMNNLISSSQPQLLQMQLTTGNDIGGCFERIAIGRKLADVTVSTPLSLLSECEMKCFQSPDCRAFAFGMGRHGNGTCEMQHGTAAERLQRRRGRRPRRLEPTQQPEDPDYDLFERRADCEPPSTTQQPPDEDDRQPPPLLVQELTPQQPAEPPRDFNREPMLKCFRRLFSGRRLSERHIRRSLPVPSAVECEMSCTRELQFVCEGFNFRGDRQRLGRSSCELSALPMAELGPSLLRDFIEDREYDFFERRRGGPPECSPQGPSRPPPDYRPSPSRPASVSGPPGNWQSSPPKHYGPQQGMSRPGQGYGSHQGPPPSFGPQRPPQSGYGPQQGPPRPPQNFGPPHGPAPGYGPQQGPPQPFGTQQRPPQHYGPQSPAQQHYGPHAPPQHQEPPHRGPQYGSHNQNQDRMPVGAPWTPDSVGFYGPSSSAARPGGFDQHQSGFGGGHGGHAGHGGTHGGDFRPGPPGIEPPSHKDDDECFSRVWSGQRLDDSVIRASASQPSLGGCQLECLHAREFTCRSFSYRHGRASPGDSCLLTDTPMSDLHPRVGLVMDPEFEVYERSSFGNGCEHIPGFPSSTPWGQATFGEENNALPPLLAQPQQSPPPRHGGGPGGHHMGGGGHHMGGGHHGGPGGHHIGGAGHREEEHECYAEYWPAAKLAATAVSVATNAMTLSECLERCTRAGQQWQTPCRSLAFRGGVHGHNCLLSELAQRDLRPDLDYIHESASESWRLMAWDWADPRCRTPPSSGPSPGPPRPGPGPQGHGPGPGPQGHGPGPHGHGHYGSDHFAGGNQGYGGPPGGNSIAHWEEPQKGTPPGGAWQGGGGGEPSHYTVSGKPCARGHVCQMNPQAGFWSCPVDNTGNSWDYCCSPSHNCGYSEGMQMPWCYVGQMKEQWRPCSERYWPYTKDNQESRREGRLLPVAFLHRSGPPGHHFNSTFHSTSRLRSLRTVSPTTLRTITPTSNSSTNDYDSHLTPVSLSIVHSKV